jgi:hypothetical protein
MMAHKIEKTEMVGYVKDIILRQAPDKPHKSLVLHFYCQEMNISGFSAHISYRVLDSLGKIRYSGDFLPLAIEAYNKLYNEDNSR